MIRFLIVSNLSYLTGFFEDIQGPFYINYITSYHKDSINVLGFSSAVYDTEPQWLRSLT